MKFQFIYWPDWIGFRFKRPTNCIKFIYEWFLLLGWWEIRKWKYPPVTQKEIDDFYKERGNNP